MCYYTITFHLAKSETALPGSSLRRLTRQHHQRTRCTTMHLVRRAVPQALIIARTNEDRCLHHAPRVSVIHNLISMRLHAIVVSQNLGEIFDGCLSKRRAIAERTRHASDFAEKRLHKLCNGHPRGDAMRIYDNVRHNACRRLRHVFRVQDHAHCTLLTVST